MLRMIHKRLPWSAELFQVLRLTGNHPIIWNGEKFVIPGPAFTILLCVETLLIALALILEVISSRTSGFNFVPVRFSNNSITTELETFVEGLRVCRAVLAIVSLIFLTLKRQQLATVFNQLNKFWIRLDCPRLRTSALSAIGALYGFGLYICMMGLTIHTLVVGEESHVLLILARLCYCLAKYVLTWFPFIVYVLMIFVYGSLADCFRFMLAAKKKRSKFSVKGNHQGVITLVFEVFSEFSSIASPLVTLSLTSIISSVMLIMFNVMISSRGLDQDLMSALISMVMLVTVLVISLNLSDLVESQLVHFRTLLDSGHFSSLSETSVQVLDATLMKIPHPAKAMGMFRFDLSILVTLAAFVVSYFMVFVQLKAIVVGSCLPTTNISTTV